MIEAWGDARCAGNIRRGGADLCRSCPRASHTDRWDGPGLGEWDLRSLVGHTSRSLLTVETYLGRPADTEEVPGPAAYYVAIADIDHCRRRCPRTGGGQGSRRDPAEFVDALAQRVIAQAGHRWQSADSHRGRGHAPRELPFHPDLRTRGTQP